MAGETDLLLSVLARSPEGLTRPQLLGALRMRVPHLRAEDVERVLGACGSRVREIDGRLFAANEQTAVVEDEPPSATLPRRFVSFDLESIVRPTVKEPYREQRIFQLGAVRFGPDSAWVAENPEMVSFTELPTEEDEQLIYRDELRERYLASKRRITEVLEQFRSFCTGADCVVAYNGVAHDFRLIKEEVLRHGLAPILSGSAAPRLVDGLYLAQALWPIPPRQHQLKRLLERLEIDCDEMIWHDALDDSKMVVELLEHGANTFLPTLGEALVGLLCASAAGSDAWELLLSLAGRMVVSDPHDHARISRALLGALQARSTKQPLRPEPPAPGTPAAPPAPSAPTPLTIPDTLRGADGRVSLEALVAHVQGAKAEPRDAQKRMADTMRGWVDAAVDALCEAPTGTGKSYAILVSCLDWLDRDPENRAIISTFTKQLQSQLAADIEALTEAAMPELASSADMVKGAVNRLSLRALCLVLADLTEPDKSRHRPGRQDFTDNPRYRELVLFLALRFVAEGKPTEEWEAHSVDRVDVPAFFDEYCPNRLSLYLASLSQAENEDYRPDRGGIGRYTLTVREALEQRRLIVANHALLLAHLDDMDGIADRTMLVVDEAHELENAATDALSAAADSLALASLAADCAEWAQDQTGLAGASQLADGALALERYLEDGRLANAAMHAFDTAERDPLGRALQRTVTVASPLRGDANVQPMLHLAGEIRTCRRTVGLLSQAFRRIAQNPPADPYDLDRFQTLWSRTADLDRALVRIQADVDAVYPPPQPGALITPGGNGQGGSQDAAGGAGADAETDGQDGAGVEQEADVDTAVVGETLADGSEIEDTLVALNAEEEAETDEDEQEPDGDGAPAPSFVRPNRVVYAEELDFFHPGRHRSYRFQLVSSPIELRGEPEWQRFKGRFACAYYVSATLRVADSWDFVRTRLDLAEDEVRALDLPSPFDAARQAELVCFSDFPSWSEHADAAMHTIAHQLAGYAAELVRPDGRNGAMVLTTSRAAAAGVFDWLARLRVERGHSYPLVSAGIEGNQRAVETFKKVGGVLVGTRGLWQGVDIADEERLRLVWINKLPFAPFADPVIEARLALEVERAALAGIDDPEAHANEHYYLPLAALSLRQAVGRLIRTRAHRGVIVISDRKLAGPTRLRRLYRRVFLGSLDAGLERTDAESGEAWLGNVCTMAEGWRRILALYAREEILDPATAEGLSSDEALRAFTELPETLRILEQALSESDLETHRTAGTLAGELLARSTAVARELNPRRGEIELKEKQAEAIRQLAAGRDLLGVLPTGYGKSYVFQLPALVLPGVTIVVSPLVSLMTDQALELNRTIGGRVRALVAPMRESNSRTGKSEVEEELKGLRSHGIKLVYLSPERLCQRHFQDWIRAGVEAGTVRRIALDEAHTFVQWGDEFRPAVRRAEDFLRRLKAEYPELQLIALTATANEMVREGLRRSLFGLQPGEERADFAFVSANPLRPELAVYRRTLAGNRAGPLSVAGLVERVVEQIDGHAIFYCLTVKQVDALCAHLRDHLRSHPVDVLRYHGRLTDAEKTGTANAFKSAPRRGEEEYRRMVVVATSAFGLGIDRSDIRAVFCVSPPTELAALYQQLGRAGRDRAAAPGDPGPYTTALSLSYPRAQRTIAFMTQPRIPSDLTARAAGLLLAAGPVVSARELARDLIAEDLLGGRIGADVAAAEETLDSYQTVVLRLVAELSLQGVVSDLGDFPRRVEIRRGDEPADTPGHHALVEAVAAAVPADRTVELIDLHAALAPAFAAEFPDPGSLWHGLLELHTLGLLDVSQRANGGGEQLTGLEHHARELPGGLLDGLSRRQAQIQAEVRRLHEWFGAGSECCNEGFRRYFGADGLPTGTCASDECRCSACWSRAGLPAEAREPALLEAFQSTDLRPASTTTRGRRSSEQQLDSLIWQLLYHNYTGLVVNIIHAVLRGEDSYWSVAERRRKPLWPRLLLSRVRGRKPGLRRAEVDASLVRLAARAEVVQTGSVRYRLARHVATDKARAAPRRAPAAP